MTFYIRAYTVIIIIKKFFLYVIMYHCWLSVSYSVSSFASSSWLLLKFKSYEYIFVPRFLTLCSYRSMINFYICIKYSDKIFEIKFFVQPNRSFTVIVHHIGILKIEHLLPYFQNGMKNILKCKMCPPTRKVFFKQKQSPFIAHTY